MANKLYKLEHGIFKNDISTGVIEFDGLSTPYTGSTTYNVGAIKAWFVDNTTDVLYPTKIYREFDATTGNTLDNIATQPVTYIGIDVLGVLHQKSSPFTSTEQRDWINLGVIVHSNNQYINTINNQPVFILSSHSQLIDLIEAISVFNINGNKISANGANLSINKSSGSIFKQGVNYVNDEKDPHTLDLDALVAPSTMRYRLQNGIESINTQFIDPLHYDLNGVRTDLQNNNKWSIQRVYVFQSNLIRIQYGQAQYDSQAEAVNNIESELFNVEQNLMENGLLRGLIIVKKSATNLSSLDEALFIDIPKFGGVAGLSSISTTTLQQAYNNSVTPEIITDSTRGALTLKGGVSDTTNIFEGMNTNGDITSWIKGDGTSSFAIAENSVTKEFTGFISVDDNIKDILVTYNPTTRTIILSNSDPLTGRFKMYYQGTEILNIYQAQWESDPHPSGVTTTQFLYYDGSNFVWSDQVWKFWNAQIALVAFDTTGFKFAARECHGTLQWQSHQRFHNTVGTTVVSGAGISGIVLNSNTATNRRPLVEATVLADEDLYTNLEALSTNSYTIMNLTGSTTNVYTTGNTEFIKYNINQPYYNQYTTSWVQTLLPVNGYMCMWLIAIPVAFGGTSQEYRYVWIQGQTYSSSLVTQQSLLSSSLNLGSLSSLANEFVFIAKAIIRNIGTNWTIVQMDELRGNKLAQTTTPAGNFLSSISTNTTLLGDGTAGDVLMVNPNLVITTLSAATSVTSKHIDIISSDIASRNDIATYGLRIEQGVAGSSPLSGSSIGIGCDTSGATIQSFNLKPLYINPLSNNVIIGNNATTKVGIGLSGATATKLHIHEPSAANNYIKITNNDTGTAVGDGLDIGITTTEKAVIWNYENTDMEFATSGLSRMTIKNTGNFILTKNGTINGLNIGTGNDVSDQNNAAFGFGVLDALIALSGSNSQYNTAMGYNSSTNITTGYQNTSFGGVSLYNNVIGVGNTALGYGSLYTTTGSSNIGIGLMAGRSAVDSNELYIDNRYRTNNTNEKNQSIIYGVMAAAPANQYLTLNANVGINTTGATATLQVHNTGAANNYIKITNNDTGTAVGDGLDIGISTTEKAVIWNYENTAMGLATNNVERLSITATGDIGIGDTTPISRLTIQGTTATDAPTLSSELITSAQTWTSSGWTGDNTTGWTHLTGSTTILTNSFSPTIGQYYIVTFTITNRTAGNFTLSFGGSSEAFQSSNSFGPLTTTTDGLVITPSSTFNGTVVFSIKQMTAVSTASQNFQNAAGTNSLDIRTNYTYQSTFVGAAAGQRNVGLHNQGFGYNALWTNTTGYQNNAFGRRALYANQTGTYNNAFGYGVLAANIDGIGNAGFGNSILADNTSGNYNVGMGYQSCYSNTTGTGNIGIGFNAVFANTTSSHNVGIGYEALRYTTTTGNIGIGRGSLYTNSTGYDNVGIGYYSLYSVTTGPGNIGLGNFSGRFATGSNELYINSQLFTTNAQEKTNSIIYGVMAASASNQTLALNAKVTINSSYSLPTTSGTSGQVLTSSGSTTYWSNTNTKYQTYVAQFDRYITGLTYLFTTESGLGRFVVSDIMFHNEETVDNTIITGVGSYSIGTSASTFTSIITENYAADQPLIYSYGSQKVTISQWDNINRSVAPSTDIYFKMIENLTGDVTTNLKTKVIVSGYYIG